MLFTPVPPKDDPSRPLILAVRSTFLLGILSVLVGLIVVIFLGYFNRFAQFRRFFAIVGALAWVTPGVVFFFCSLFIAKRSKAAVVLAMVATGVQLVWAIVIFVATVTLNPVSLLPPIVAAAWIAALGQLMWHLLRALRAVRLDTQFHPGFELLQTRPVMPVESSDKQENS